MFEFDLIFSLKEKSYLSLDIRKEKTFTKWKIITKNAIFSSVILSCHYSCNYIQQKMSITIS